MCKYKIICLSEIKADSVDCVSIKKFAADHNFVSYCKPHAKALRKPGGLCTLFANDIATYVREIPSTLETVQWFTVDNDLFGMDKDLLLGNICISPPSSPYASDGMFMDLEMSLLDLYYINYHVMLVGDFNAHRSIHADTLIYNRI